MPSSLSTSRSGAEPYVARYPSGITESDVIASIGKHKVGIYTPEARTIRLAKFHEKRKRRVWRKRIKYDCRKKLADSRPRIKGRFVKRSPEEIAAEEEAKRAAKNQVAKQADGLGICFGTTDDLSVAVHTALDDHHDMDKFSFTHDDHFNMSGDLLIHA
jgi:hypothetical protein